jgi:hypothetical protein
MKRFVIFILTLIIILAIFYKSAKKCKTTEGFGLDFLFFPICIIIGIFEFLGAFILIVVWVVQCIPSLPDILIWAVTGFMCGLTGIFNLPKCFLWYLLEWIGWVIYLPFRLLFSLMDSAMHYIIGKKMVVDIEHKIWCFLEDLDKYIHKSTKIHIIHYPDSVVKKCYTCKMPIFPKLPKFPEDALDLMANAFNC